MPLRMKLDFESLCVPVTLRYQGNPVKPDRARSDKGKNLANVAVALFHAIQFLHNGTIIKIE